MRLYLDACSIIYSIEGLPAFRDPVKLRIRQTVTSKGGVLITSRLSRLECRIKPMRDGRSDLLLLYQGFFSHRLLRLSEVSGAVIDRATDLRPAHGFKTPHAIHLATALEERADPFLTGDARLARCPGLYVEVVLTLSPPHRAGLQSHQ